MPAEHTNSDLHQKIARLEKEVTQYQQLELRLKEESSFRQAIIARAAEGICVCHAIPEFPYVSFNVWNDRMTDITGFSVNDINRQGWYQSLYPDPEVQARAAARMDAMREGEDLHSEEWEITRKDGSQRVVTISTSLLETTDGTAHVLAVINDITPQNTARRELQSAHNRLEQEVRDRTRELEEANATLKREIKNRHRAQEAMLISEARYRNLIEQSPLGISIFQSDGTLIYANDAMRRLHGLTHEKHADLINRYNILKDKQLVENDFFSLIGKAFAGSAVTLPLIEYDLKDLPRLESGSYRQILVEPSLYPVTTTGGEVENVILIHKDVSKLKIAEAEMLREKQFSETLINQMPGSFYMFGEDGRMLRWNNNLEKVSGFSKNEIGRMSALDFFDEDDKDKVKPRIEEVFIKGATQGGANLLAKDGRKIPHVLTGARIEFGGAAYLLGVGLDITDRKAAEMALTESEERFRQIAENIREVFWLFDWQQQRVLYVSPAYDQVWGRSREALYEDYADWGESIHPDDRSHAEETFNRILETGGGEQREYRILRPDGSVRWLSDIGYAIKNDKDEIVRITGIAEDITAAKRTEAELLKMEKLKSVGVLAGGIAHDFNNFLTGIVGNLSLAQLDLEPGNPIAPRLQEMEKAALRAKDLTQQLLTFSKGGEPVKSLVEIDNLVREAALFALRGSNVSCAFNFPEDPWTARVDSGQIGQVIHNLILNADQVMPEGGLITISIVNYQAEIDTYQKLDPGPYIQIVIQDQGTGIKKEHLDKIFNPYFTTKQKGSGLGLAIVYSIISKHNGLITVESTLGMGSTFKIYPVL